MQVKATIKSIGKQAIDPKEPMLILFNNHATPEIRDVAVIQEFQAKTTKFELHVGDQLKIDEQVYSVSFVGELVSSNMASIGHATLYFTEVPEQPMQNAIYLGQHELPKIKIGSTIIYG